ncbi:hypothetical protein LSCM1_06040 [Leishmania martiniquensis]|uniref:Uncharacterized protein n=1 Tax=Leishmania martiniquensis TaxID=1580590 RepID=A0A836GNY8_9TRYP|nr:hypothetical protein LSCM1_06040 [Leishmania martiniquensis]
MHTERDVSVPSGFASPGPSYCLASSSLSSLLPASANRRAGNAPPLSRQYSLAPDPCRAGQEMRRPISFATINELTVALLDLMRAIEYDTYRVQSVATEAMANLQVVWLHLIERTLNATAELEETRLSQKNGEYSPSAAAAAHVGRQRQRQRHLS